jgi:YidC/Oxa1 family membrane protein insertase
LALFDIFKPLKNAWWAIFGANISWTLHTIYTFLAANPILAAIGAYGLSIIILTILIKTILSPLYQLQLRLSRRSMEEQRKLAPELAALRKKYKNDPQKQQSEMMALYKEHGVNPLGGLTGCLPALLQFPKPGNVSPNVKTWAWQGSSDWNGEPDPVRMKRAGRFRDRLTADSGCRARTAL